MPTLGVELLPEDDRFLDDGSEEPGATTPSAGAVPGASDLQYVDRVARYERELAAGLQRIRFDRLPAEARPSLEVSLPGRKVAVVLDAALDARLLEIYVVHGWAGIRAVQAALRRAAEGTPSRFLWPWGVIAAFFAFTRNRLVLQVRAALIAVERLAAADLVTGLEAADALATAAWDALQLETSTTDASGRTKRLPARETSPSWDTPLTRAKLFYSIGAPELGAELLTATNRAVEELRLHLDLEARRDRLAEAIESFRSEVSGGAPSEYDLAELIEKAAEQSKVVEERYREVHALCPLAVLAIPLLAPPVTLGDLGQAIGECLTRLKEDTARLAEGLSRRESWVQDLAPVVEGPLETLFPPELCLEDDAVRKALEEVERDPACFSLLRHETLVRLVERGLVVKDDLRFVVLSHTITAILTEQAKLQERQEQLGALARGLAKLAAAMSIVSLVVPAARGVSTLLDMGLLAYQAYDVVHQLSRMDQLVSERLLGLNARRAEEVAALGRVAQMRPEYRSAMTRALETEILLIAAGGALPQFQLALHLRGFHFDLETLVGD